MSSPCAARGALVGVLLPLLAAIGEADRLYTGFGTADVTFAASGQPNGCAALTADVAPGASALSVGTFAGPQPGPGQLVLVYQSTGVLPYPPPAISPIDLTTQGTGRFEFARVVATSPGLLTLRKPMDLSVGPHQIYLASQLDPSRNLRSATHTFVVSNAGALLGLDLHVGCQCGGGGEPAWPAMLCVLVWRVTSRRRERV